MIMKKNITIILDPAHGEDVPGKRSPDGVHREYRWSRERVRELKVILEAMGYEVYKTTDSENEPGLSKRKNFASSLKSDKPKLLLSLHNNAAGNGSAWMNVRGIAVYTSKGVTKSDVCADFIIEQFKKDFPEFKIRMYRAVNLEKDFEENFTVLMGNGYMGVLIEWLFQDNKEDVKELQSYRTNKRFEDSLVEAIESINGYFGKDEK